ncbi:MAG: TonB-dependent receptor [Pseudomonadota bacterium]
MKTTMLYRLFGSQRCVAGRSGSACQHIFFGAGLLFSLVPACAAPVPVLSYADMSFEELGSIRITSVSKKPEKLADAAASVFIITADDIRRSGATSLPEVLRRAPNLNVAQVSGGGYAISARGLNGSNNSAPNKLLVLIDGRSVYSPLFSGVFWDVQDVMLDDIERIEVISGPGGTLWGVNAVNGVINVITRPASQTQGGLVSIGGGNRGNDTAFRYGGTFGDDGSYRIYGKRFDRKHTSTESGATVNDAGHNNQIGFRADWRRPRNQVTVHGNAYTGSADQPAPGAINITGTNLALGPIDTSGANLTTRWQHLLEDDSSLSFQVYLDHTRRRVPPTFSETLNIVDMEFQHSLRPSGGHAVVWGANYRYGMDHVSNSAIFAILPGKVNQKWASLFVQDEITLRKNLELTIGARLERNDYTGNEILPNLRLAWKFAPDHLLWTAASRAVRAPSRLDSDAFIPGVPPYLLNGGRTVRSEVANVYELGYRGQFGNKTSYSITAFHNVYDHLRTQEVDPGRTFLIFANEMEGTASGVETWGTYQATPGWRLSAGYTALRENFRLKSGSNDLNGPGSAGKDPAHTWQLRSSFTMAPDRELDISVRHAAALSNPAVPAYTAVDARFGWKLRRDLELSITGQNLFGTRHAEYGPLATRSEIPTSVYLKLLWKL